MVKGDLGRLMKQAQKMQADMQKAQEELGGLEVTGESGGGMVQVTLNGRYQVRRVKVEDAVAGDDREMLEDLLAAAFNDAVRKVEEAVREKFSGLTSGLGLPPGFNLPI